MTIISGSPFGGRDIQPNQKSASPSVKQSASPFQIPTQPDVVQFGLKSKIIEQNSDPSDPFVSAQSKLPASHAVHSFQNFLSRHHIDINRCNNKGENALMMAAEKGMSHVADLLIAAGCVISQTDHKGQTALMKAAANGHEDIIQKMLAAMPDDPSRKALVNVTDKSGQSAATLAYQRGFYRVVILLHRHGADISQIKVQ